MKLCQDKTRKGGKKDRRVHCKLKTGWRDERMLRHEGKTEDEGGHEGKIQDVGMKDERKKQSIKKKEKTGMREQLQRERKRSRMKVRKELQMVRVEV